MKITIHDSVIDVKEIPTYPLIDWEPILDELKAEHIPGLYPHGKRMGVNIVNNRPRGWRTLDAVKTLGWPTLSVLKGWAPLLLGSLALPPAIFDL
jgi:hypothetical protein